MRDVGALEHGPIAAYDLVDPIVILKVVVPRNVVILRVLGTPDQAAALIVGASHGLEPDREVDVLRVRVLDQGDVENGVVALGRLGQRLARVRVDDLPLADLVREALGDDTRLVAVERPGLFRVVRGEQREGRGPDQR